MNRPGRPRWEAADAMQIDGDDACMRSAPATVRPRLYRAAYRRITGRSMRGAQPRSDGG